MRGIETIVKRGDVETYVLSPKFQTNPNPFKTLYDWYVTESPSEETHLE
ncbi:hypothetical protein [Chryseobacterium oncorhynchi]|nr:hypothetical protein [Chryseobacterium oncorhynchi]